MPVEFGFHEGDVRSAVAAEYLSKGFPPPGYAESFFGFIPQMKNPFIPRFFVVHHNANNV
jgi:hypothetical protein